MKVLRGFSTDKTHALTSPFPAKPWSVFFEMRGGDVCEPLGFGTNWFHPPYPKVWKWLCRWPVLPYFAWRFNKRAGYIGFKAYGVDAVEYKAWMDPADVFDGSQALCITARPFATLRE